MKHLKMLAIAAIALMAFGAGTASATKLYSGAMAIGKGTNIQSSLSGSTTLETTSGTVFNTCTGGVAEGKTTTTGGSAETVKGNIEKLTWTGCAKHTTTISNGSLEIHHIAGTKNGTVVGSGSAVKIDEIFGKSCVYGTGAGTNLGTLIGSTTGNAILAIKATVPLVVPEFLCPSTAVWKANYTITSPSPLHVTAS